VITSANCLAFSICTGVSIATSSRFEDFFLPFGGKLSGDNRWIKLAELIPWDELEDGYAAQFCKGFGAPAKPFRMAIKESRTFAEARRQGLKPRDSDKTRGF
jgi:hypothetical protein